MVIKITKPEKINEEMRRIAVQLTLREHIHPRQVNPQKNKKRNHFWAWLRGENY